MYIFKKGEIINFELDVDKDKIELINKSLQKDENNNMKQVLAEVLTDILVSEKVNINDLYFLSMFKYYNNINKNNNKKLIDIVIQKHGLQYNKHNDNKLKNELLDISNNELRNIVSCLSINEGDPIDIGITNITSDEEQKKLKKLIINETINTTNCVLILGIKSTNELNIKKQLCKKREGIK